MRQPLAFRNRRWPEIYITILCCMNDMKLHFKLLDVCVKGWNEIDTDSDR